MKDIRQEPRLLFRRAIGEQHGGQHAGSHATDLGGKAGVHGLTLPDEALGRRPAGASELDGPFVDGPAARHQRQMPALFVVAAMVVGVALGERRGGQRTNLIAEGDFGIREAQVHGQGSVFYYIPSQ